MAILRYTIDLGLFRNRPAMTLAREVLRAILRYTIDLGLFRNRPTMTFVREVLLWLYKAH